ncbi:MAG TPA: M48 family metallopeptidase [Vicinamibacterales bacterium]|nr:M48 family metallopeptidase [Vicinamibacterales bacterium]
MKHSSPLGWRAHLHVSALVLLLGVASAAQTPITPPDNKFTPAEDVKLGREAAQQVEQELPILRDQQVDAFVDDVGRRLAAAVPPAFRHPEFEYSFTVVNARDINAFALPGGPMFINRGMITAARTEGEVAGVMAHELSHVVLRHGTAQASQATKYQLGQLAGQVIGAIVGGTAGAVIAQGSQFGLGAAFLRFSREYERQADLLGAQIMARAGYDPMQMATMFETIRRQGGSRGPEWLSSHPNPGNRQEAIEKEARMLQVRDQDRESPNLAAVQARLERMPRALSTEEIARRGGSGGGGGEVGTTGTLSASVEPPSRDFRTHEVGKLFSVSVPENWQPVPAGNAVRFAPEGASASSGRRQVFTHGIEFGVAANDSADLEEATQALVSAFAQSNPGLKVAGRAQRVEFGGRQGLRVTLRNASSATGREEAVVLTAALLDGNDLFYSVGVAPVSELGTYRQALARVNDSVRLR